jgi:hypothetical protein
MHDSSDDLNLYDFGTEADHGPQRRGLTLVFDPKRTVAAQRRDLRASILEKRD